MERLMLPPDEVRVLGCLVEKQLTTPQQYPLTLNALTLACNQSSNRDPVLSMSEHDAERAVTSAKARGLAHFVHPSHGRSALRFRHTLDEVLELEPRPLAVLAVLMLRGPQTPGELRARTERMADFSSLGDIDETLEDLAGRPTALVERLPRKPGHKEVRFAHLVGDGAGTVASGHSSAEAPGEAAPIMTTASSPTVSYPAASPHSLPVASNDHVNAAIEDLQAQVDELRKALEDLRSELGA